MWTLALIAVALLTGLFSGAVLRALPEPTGPDAGTKTPYRELATPRFAMTVAAAALAAGAVLIFRLPPVCWPVWVPLATVGVLLVTIDAFTTWLPLPLTRVLWLTTLLAAVLQIVVSPPSDRGALALRMVLGAAAVTLFFWGFWWFVGGLGFGDVRLSPVLGAVTASISWPTLAGGLLLGTFVGAVFGLARRAYGRRGPFPYGPALVLGAFLGPVLVR